MFEVEDADQLPEPRQSNGLMEGVEDEAIPRVVRVIRDSHSKKRELSKSPSQRTPSKIQLNRVNVRESEVPHVDESITEMRVVELNESLPSFADSVHFEEVQETPDKLRQSRGGSKHCKEDVKMVFSRSVERLIEESKRMKESRESLTKMLESSESSKIHKLEDFNTLKESGEKERRRMEAERDVLRNNKHNMMYELEIERSIQEKFKFYRKQRESRERSR